MREAEEKERQRPRDREKRGLQCPLVLGRRERKRGRERGGVKRARGGRGVWIEGYGENDRERRYTHGERKKREREVEFPRSFTRGPQLRMRASFCSKSQNVCNTHAYWGMTWNTNTRAELIEN
jgi:hypothetical protein